MSKYTVIIYTPQELNHSSYIQTGLFELEQMGFLKVKVKLDTAKKLGRTIISKEGKISFTKQPHPKTSFYKLINNSTKEQIYFATDLYDFSNHFSTVALEKCDYLFKRNYDNDFVNVLEDNYKCDILKLGLSFGVHSSFKHSNTKFMLGLFLSNLNVNFKIDRLLFIRLINSYKAQLQHWNFINTTRKLERFKSYNLKKEDIILFQTRCFLSENQKDVLDIHQQRYKIIKLLKNTFKNHFFGGFIPSKIATEKYSDALTNVPSSPELYLDTLKKAKIVIYTRGLVNSPAWKMAEYLSQGKVIIAERLTANLPMPLEHGKELLFFDTNKELINNIHLVLSDEKLARCLSNNARAYFEKYVNPVKNVKRILDIMITKLEDSNEKNNSQS